MREDTDKHAVVVGGGGIARALVARLSARSDVERVTNLARGIQSSREDFLATHPIDILDESSIVAAADFTATRGPVDTVIVATGILHDQSGMRPEKRLAEVTPDRALRSFGVNALGPALVAKHMMPLMRKQSRNVFAALSARVGSIEDNRLGGWYSYRASKAALNMLLRCVAIEQARVNKHSIIAGLHPGTVDTALSAPFQRNVPEDQLFSPTDAAQKLLDVLDGLVAEDSGKVFAWDGSRIPS